MSWARRFFANSGTKDPVKAHVEVQCVECHQVGCEDCGMPIVHRLDCTRLWKDQNGD